MKLNSESFDRVRFHGKVIGLRIYDEKRQKVSIGDKIVFYKRPDLDESITVNVIGFLRYSSFEDLVNDFPLSYFGFSKDFGKEEYLKLVRYSKEQVEKFGVLGTRISLEN